MHDYIDKNGNELTIGDEVLIHFRVLGAHSGLVTVEAVGLGVGALQLDTTPNHLQKANIPESGDFRLARPDTLPTPEPPDLPDKPELPEKPEKPELPEKPEKPILPDRPIKPPDLPKPEPHKHGKHDEPEHHKSGGKH